MRHILFLCHQSILTRLRSSSYWVILTESVNHDTFQLTLCRVIRAYDFTITRGWAAPDGYYKDVMLVNNQFPGPLIEANWCAVSHPLYAFSLTVLYRGDTIQVTVHNQITAPEEGTALHWHGILQKDMQ